MAMTNRTLKAAARLAAATALTGTLAACDGRLGTLFAPSGSTPDPIPEAALQPPAKPGNPVYNGGSRAANEAAYEQEYGAPVEGSGQALAAATPGYAPSVYDDQSVKQTALETVSPVLQPVAPPSVDVYADPVQPIGAVTEPLTGAYSAPVEYSAPVTTEFPPIGTTVYEPQSSITVPELDIFSDASYQPGPAIETGEAEPMMSRPADSFAMPAEEIQTAYVIEDRRYADPLGGTYVQPYGSTASHRYSVPSLDAVPSVEIGYASITEDPLPAPEPVAMPEDEPVAKPVEVAFLAIELAPMPRPRPVREYQEAALTSPVPMVRPQIIEALASSPLPPRRPLDRVAVSGRAITDAPPLTETPKMIEVAPTFADEPPVIEETEVAALEPTLEIMDEAEFPAEAEAPAEPSEAAAETEASVEPEPAPEPDPEPQEVAALATRSDAFEDDGEAAELSGTSWRLTGLADDTVEADAELHFDGTSGFAGGQAFCNNYGGEFTEKLDGTFDMANIFTTETQCPHLSSEKRFIAALEKAARYEIEDGMKTLSLLDDDGKAIATFTAF